MRTMEAEVKENSENVAPSTECSLLKQTDEIKDEKSGETEAINTNQQQQMTGKAEQTSGDGDGETRQVRIRKQVQRFSETMSKRYADEQAAKEKAHDAVAAQLGKGSGTPLSEIPLIEASIRGCKPMDLKTLHYACFGRVGGVAEVRSNLRKFSGFSFGRESEEYGKRVQALNRKPVKEVQNALRQLHLEVSGTRVQLVTRLLDFLLKPVADAVKCKGKLPPSKRKPGAGCKSLSKKEEDDKKCPSNKPKKSAEESETEGDEIGCSSDGAEQGEEEEAEPVVGPEAEEEDEYEVEEDDEEESGMSDADYAPGKKVAKKRRSTAVVKTSKSPRKAKRRRKQVIESDEYDRIGANDGDRSSTKEEAEVADVEAKDEEMKELMQSKGAGRAREGAAEDRGNASSSKPASHSAVFPSDEELKSKVLEILRNANLNEVSMKVVRTSVSEHYKDVDLSPKKQFINGVIEEGCEALQSAVVYSSVNPTTKRHRYCQALVLSPWIYISTAGFITALVVGIYLFSQTKLKPIDIDRLEVAKCPSCFGQSACPSFFRGGVRLATFYGSRPIHASDFEKLSDRIDVDLGMFERRPAVLRRLQFPSTSEAVDVEVCRRQRTEDLQEGSPQPRCVPHLSIWRWMSTTGVGTGDPIDLGLLRSTSAFTRCASPRLLQLIQSRYRERSTNPNLPPQSRWLRFDELTLLFNIAINPHAVIASTFPASEGWPFPVQLGACGRMTLEKGTAKSLSQFAFAPAKQRLQILRSLLQLPASLTSNSSLKNAESADFALYIGDYRWNTFGVDVFTYQVSVIQSRHLIAVDLREITKPPSHFIIEANASYILHDGCHDRPFASTTPCLSEEHANQLCASNSLADHNYWAVCMAALLDDGVLVRDMPTDLIFSLEQCIKDAQDGARQSHVEAALEIIDLELTN